MAEPRVRPYGSWKSPITSNLIVSGSIGVSQTLLDDGDIYWSEMRPTEAGRSVIVKRDSAGIISDITPSSFNARTRAHEYGGGDYTVHKGDVYFSNFADQRLYVQRAGQQPVPLTPATPAAELRYADAIVDARRQRLICIREDHTVAGREAVNSLVSLDLRENTGAGQVLASGNDFYSSPRLSPDGSRLAWITWNHPNMPWDGTELWTAKIGEDGLLEQTERVTGGVSESVFQPEWSPEGVLYFVSDRTGWWNLHRVNDAGDIEIVHAREAEFGMPQWGFGMSSYAFESADRVVCNYIENGISGLAAVDTRTKEFTRLDTPYTDIRYLRAQSGEAVMRAASPTAAAAVVRLDLKTGSIQALRRSHNLEIDPGYFSTPQPIEFPTEDGLTAHAFFYPPANRDFRAPEGDLPPLLVQSHGGPTAAATTASSLSIQYWTSRGIAVLDVNYGGSTGFGRNYRERLKGKWGIVDVDDCANGARYLVQQGRVDGDRLMITGGSAGGYTTLCALTFRRAFNAGASHYGVSDAEALAKETHKFESRYLDGLMGPYPEKREVYHERSPINFTERLSCPVIFFQGLEDKVVPPNQAEMMVDALREKGIPVAYIPFAGEQHGFRQAQNIKRALDGELYFYSRVFGFELAEPVEPVAIENL
ncbi:MAG TPA: prolyl oligopeptidase family serine peptidase [Pyrinomonadaceae bacterium]|nr:prolyl oligopeptidase family serine peptidase [Pyrinomonadaceae bacterium]